MSNSPLAQALPDRIAAALPNVAHLSPAAVLEKALGVTLSKAKQNQRT